tara:strand:+ start:11192 stop:12871 length:1680 start_codon:yes stop_codon:yes gene_type:complete
MSQIYRESLRKFETVTLDYEIPIWKESANKDAQLKRITLRDFFASDVISTVIDPPNWGTDPLIVTGSHTHNLAGNTVTLRNGVHTFDATLEFRALGNVLFPNVTQNDALTKLAVFDSNTGQIKWRNASTLSGDYFDKTSDDTDNITEGANKFVTSAHLIKLGHISVSQAVNLDTMESNISANNTKNTNVNTNLSESSFNANTVTIGSSDGDDVILVGATTSRAGLLTSSIFDSIAANTLKVSNQPTNIVIGTPTATTNVIGSSDGSNGTLSGATTVYAGLLIAADKVKLTGIENLADVTNAANVTSAGALMDSEVTNLAQVKAFDSSDYATSAQGTLASNALPKSGGAMVGAITTNSTFDGRNVATDGTKLDGIQAGATPDQTDSEIETAYNNQVAAVTQAEAEAGTVTTVKRWTPERVKQAITALGGTPSLNNGQVFVGNASNSATSVAMSGDVAINNAGATTIQPDSVSYDKMQDVSQAALLGNQTGAGTVEEIPIIEQFIPTGSTRTLLETTSNWDVNGIYTGSTITGTYQGQSHYNQNYFFMAVDDNVWIRLIRG